MAINGRELGALFLVVTLGFGSGRDLIDDWFRLKCVKELTSFVSVAITSSKCVGCGCGGFSDGSCWKKHAGHRLPLVCVSIGGLVGH